MSFIGEIRRCLGGLVLAVVVGLGGCSTMPSPLIVGNTYTNFQYEFSLDLPSGWRPAENPEVALESYAHWVDDDIASLVLTNEDSQGLIAVLNRKHNVDYPRYIDLDVRYWEYRIKAMQTKLAAEVEVLSYDYHIYKDNLVTTQQNFFISQRVFKPEKVFGVDARIVDKAEKKQMTFEWFLFPCQKDRSCHTIVMLSCHEDRYEENRPAFESIVATLRAHDYYN
ncbi:MAG: hypothetical protein PVJ53_02875 [Desulfobacterales bacterium]